MGTLLLQEDVTVLTARAWCVVARIVWYKASVVRAQTVVTLRRLQQVLWNGCYHKRKRLSLDLISVRHERMTARIK
jgi:hypothetical protein